MSRKSIPGKQKTVKRTSFFKMQGWKERQREEKKKREEGEDGEARKKRDSLFFGN